MAEQHVGALLIQDSGFFNSHPEGLAAFAVSIRVPTVQINVFADQLGSYSGPHANGRPAWPYPVHATEPRFVSKHDAQPPAAPCRGSPRFPYSIRKAVFLKASCAARSRLG